VQLHSPRLLLQVPDICPQIHRLSQQAFDRPHRDHFIVIDDDQILLDRHDQHLVTAIGRANRLDVTIHLDCPVVGDFAEVALALDAS